MSFFLNLFKKNFNIYISTLIFIILSYEIYTLHEKLKMFELKYNAIELKLLSLIDQLNKSTPVLPSVEEKIVIAELNNSSNSEFSQFFGFLFFFGSIFFYLYLINKPSTGSECVDVTNDLSSIKSINSTLEHTNNQAERDFNLEQNLDCDQEVFSNTILHPEELSNRTNNLSETSFIKINGIKSKIVNKTANYTDINFDVDYTQISVSNNREIDPGTYNAAQESYYRYCKPSLMDQNQAICDSSSALISREVKLQKAVDYFSREINRVLGKSETSSLPYTNLPQSIDQSSSLDLTPTIVNNMEAIGQVTENLTNSL